MHNSTGVVIVFIRSLTNLDNQFSEVSRWYYLLLK